jgi:hypothetical protein
MARIRSIKPEFFTDEDLGQLPPAVRLLFIGMWTEADKAGRLKDKPKTLKARCLPFDNVDVEKALVSLASGKFIIRYAIGGEQYIQIRTWDEHQRPHHTERVSTIPAVVNGEITVNAPLINGDNDASSPSLNGVNDGGPPSLNGGKQCSRKREPSLPFLSLPFPSSLEGHCEFRQLWESWVKHRVEIKKPLTEEQAHKQLEQFGEWGPERSVVAMKHTIKQGWQGLREPEQERAGNGSPKRDIVGEHLHKDRKHVNP